MVTHVPQLGNAQLYNYRYDQLNRLVLNETWRGYNVGDNSWYGMSKSSDYKEQITYDANGNIKTYLRNADGGGTAMDNLTYQYEKNSNDHIVSNRLRYVHDQVTLNAHTVDIKTQTGLTLIGVNADKNVSQPGDNYGYDAIGNLTKDQLAGISNITWTVYGKIKKITKPGNEAIEYTYDAAGNRISKKYTPASGNPTITWYVRDAQGNVMATYKHTGSSYNSAPLYLKEQHIYGCDKLCLLYQPYITTSGYT